MKLWKNLAVVLAAVFSWFSMLVLLGLLGVLANGVSLISVLGILIGLSMAWPVKLFYQNFENLDGFMLERVRDESHRIALSFVLFGISSYSFVYGVNVPVVSLLNFSFHASSQIFFPVKIFYQLVGSELLANLSFQLGRWYLHFIVVYLVSGFVVEGFEKLSVLAER